jgi:Ser/Thr protein kinase RdoA (MazF antagonist)
MNEGLLRRALKFYGVRPVRIFDGQKGYRNKSFHIRTAGGDDLNLIFFKSEAGILERVKRADRLSEVAYEAGLPVRHLFDRRILVLTGVRGKIYARLYYYLPGETIAWEMFSMNHIKALGWAMSDLHFVWRDFGGELPLAADELLMLNGRMKRYFDDVNVVRAMLGKLGLALEGEIFGDFGQTLETVGKLEAQPLHLDLVRGNLLFGGDGNGVWRVGNASLAGIIDFEKAAMGHPMLDLARTYAFLMVDVANKTQDRIFKYLIQSGYQKRGRNKIELDIKLFEKTVQFFLMYDFYKFLRHNPYESLSENHHFMQTRDILIQRNVIKLV